MLTNQTFAFIGAGAMAEAIIGGLIRKELVKPDQISVTNHSDKDKLLRLEKEYGIRSFQLKDTNTIEASVIILAMKPRHAEDAIQSIRHKLSNEQLSSLSWQVFLLCIWKTSSRVIRRLYGRCLTLLLKLEHPLQQSL